MAKYKLGLALSGGGAKGIAHIGVLQALEDHGYKPDILAGTSAGAVAAVFYAAGKSPVEILAFVKAASLFKVFKVGMPYTGLTKHTYLHDRLKEIIGEDSFEALQKPLHIAMSNLNTGECEIRSSGPLFDVVTASAALPLVFQPVEIDGQLYVDGGLLENLPTAVLRDQVDCLLGVNVIPSSPIADKEVQNFFGIAQRCFDLPILLNSKPSIALCDLLIEPLGVRKYNIFSLNKYKAIYEIGYKAMADKMGDLEKLLS